MYGYYMIRHLSADRAANLAVPHERAVQAAQNHFRAKKPLDLKRFAS
jgi:hypothetical protein